MSYSIAVVPGDGIGTEVVSGTVSVLDTLASIHGFELEKTDYELGAEFFLEHGQVMKDGTMDALRTHDAVLLGAVGHPDVNNAYVAAEGHHRIRREFDLWANLRPAVLYADHVSPLDGYQSGEIDILWFRENSEGAYLDMGGKLQRNGETEMALQCAAYTRKGIERIARAAFDAAREREGIVHTITKSNVLSYGSTFWDEVVAAVADEYPAVTLEHLYVDAANLRIVTQPELFDVVVAPNLFSDILTDATAGVVGGLGLAPSSNVNLTDPDIPGMFEPVHGTAPDIAGEGTANPLASVLSGGLLLEDLGENAAATHLEDTVRAQLQDLDAPRTPDLGGDTTTTAVIKDLEKRLQSSCPY
ncbi:MAG TPA: isocitrate/isopropylmalate dehydrogenase family protein [Halococcus sp.]|nr:isocitrate/isopropylmalate dehydrogenase family protein [Halococcus sp.]